MIEEQELNTLLKAKRDSLVVGTLLSLALGALAILLFLEIIGLEHSYTIPLVSLSAIFISLSSGDNRWVSTSRGRLIQTLENIVSGDSNAIEALAKLKSA